jgi:hypothetical protein
MTNWTHKQKPNNDFMSSFSQQTKEYLGIVDGFPSTDISKWLLDSFQILNTNWPNIYNDYSFIIVPASKALENWIFKLAKDLNIEVKTDKVGVVRDQIESHLKMLLEEIEKKTGESIEIDINYLKIFIKEYRHEIVHYNKKIDSFGMAKSKVFTIFERINSVTDKLLDSDLIKVNAREG